MLLGDPGRRFSCQLMDRRRPTGLSQGEREAMVDWKRFPICRWSETRLICSLLCALTSVLSNSTQQEMAVKQQKWLLTGLNGVAVRLFECSKVVGHGLFPAQSTNLGARPLWAALIMTLICSTVYCTADGFRSWAGTLVWYPGLVLPCSGFGFEEEPPTYQDLCESLRPNASTSRYASRWPTTVASRRRSPRTACHMRTLDGLPHDVHMVGIAISVPTVQYSTVPDAVRPKQTSHNLPEDSLSVPSPASASVPRPRLGDAITSSSQRAQLGQSSWRGSMRFLQQYLAKTMRPM
nr:hypothetical protein CFP56_28524 [Quercus suber]